MGLFDAWEAMERKASAMTRAKNMARQEVDSKIETIKKYNREHPITSVRTETRQKCDPPLIKTESSTIVYNSADYVLGYLFPPKRKKK